MIKIWLILGICSVIVNMFYKIKSTGTILNSLEETEVEVLKKIFFQIIGGGISLIYVFIVWWKNILLDINDAICFLKNQF